jgi:hypothetical protein
MRFSYLGVALAALAFSGAAQAQTEAAPAAETAAPAEAAAAPSVELKSGLTIRTADGRRIGRAERVVKDADGAPTSVAVIYDSRFVYLPVATLSSDDKGIVTSLSRAEVAKLR